MANDLSYATPRMRCTAYWIDFLVLLSFVYCFGRVLWVVVPNSEVPMKAMQLFSAKEFQVYGLTTLTAALLILLYHCILPLFGPQTTLGGYVVKMRIVKPDGSRLGFPEALRRFVVIALKCVLIFAVGPVLALIGGNVALSSLGLFLPIGFLVISALTAQRKPDGAWVWEKIGGYRYVKDPSEQSTQGD